MEIKTLKKQIKSVESAMVFSFKEVEEKSYECLIYSNLKAIIHLSLFYSRYQY